jgi:SEC-C motif
VASAGRSRPLPEDLVQGLLFSLSKESHTMTRIGKQPSRYRFILNPYPEERFVFCPECDGPTESRKFPLVIHVDPRNPVTLNKTCRYCPRCDLLIAHRDELEEQLVVLFEKRDPELIGNDYLVIGTLDHEVWERGCQTPLTIQEMLANLHDFQVVLRIDPADREGSLPARGFKKPPSRGRPGSARRKPPSPSVAPGAPAERNLGRNDPCWCGSGKKYKNCHMRQDIK